MKYKFEMESDNLEEDLRNLADLLLDAFERGSEIQNKNEDEAAKRHGTYGHSNVSNPFQAADYFKEVATPKKEK